MVLRTKVKTEKSEFKINLNSKILTIGSCFSDVIGNYFSENKIDCLANPFGTVYNLQSISNLLTKAINSESFDENQYVNHQESFYCYELHSTFNNVNLAHLKSDIFDKQIEVKHFFQNADYLIITLGTSWIYEHKTLQQIVNNCHKQNAKLFEKKLLLIETQKTIFKQLYNYLNIENKNLKIILTVSPVRHIKDTLELNNVSKSILNVLCYDICQMFSNVFYFPSFEIMNDDLRDYRFYKNDLIHPNELAENYILDVFSEKYFDTKLMDFISEWQKIKLAINHKPFNPKSQNHQDFLKQTILKIKALQSIINIETELNILTNQLL